MGNIDVIVPPFGPSRVARFPLVQVRHVCGERSGEMVPQPVPQQGPVQPPSPRKPVKGGRQIHVIADRPIVPEMAEEPPPSRILAVGRRDKAGAPSRLVRKDAEREGEERHVGNVEIDRLGHDVVADDHLHLRTQKVIMRMIGIARGVPPVRDEEDILFDLLDRFTVIEPIFDLRFADADLPFFRPEVVLDGLSIVRLASILHHRSPDQLLPLLVCGVLDSFRGKGRRVPVHLYPFGLQTDRPVLQLTLAEQVHGLCPHGIDDGIFCRVDDERIDAGSAGGECVFRNGTEGIRKRGGLLGMHGDRMEKANKKDRNGTSAWICRREK